MNAAAVEVVKQFTDIVIAYGQSDEYRYATNTHSPEAIILLEPERLMWT